MCIAKLLIVEDDLVIAKEIQSILEKRGYKIIDIVTTQQDTSEAIKADRPDLVLVDIKLNTGTEGISIAKNVRNWFSIPTIFITRLLDEKIFVSAKEAFPQNFITKPFTDATLLHAVELAIQNSSKQLLKTSSFVEHLDEHRVLLKNTNSAERKQLQLKDILYILAGRAYSNIYFESDSQDKSNSLKLTLSSNHLVEQLAFPQLVKVHKSYYVNVKKIETMSGMKIWVKGQQLPVSLRGMFSLKNALRTFNIVLVSK